MEILLYFLVFCAGALAGFLLKWWLDSRKSYSGTIFVTKDDQKTLYSTELDEYPESIEFRKEIVFKVDTSELESDRE